MHPAAPFVTPAWRRAFEAIEDASPTLVAGTALWVRTTHVVYKKRFLRRELKVEQVTEEPANDAYYVLTSAGLHVAQGRPQHVGPQEPDFRGDEDGTVFDFFVPRDRIENVARWEVGEGGVMAKIAVEREGAYVDIRFAEGARQFSGGTVDDIAAALQRENLIRGIIDGVAPIIESATKTCPDCAERVKYLAHVCRYCGYRFDGGGYARGSMLKALASRLADRIAETRYGTAAQLQLTRGRNHGYVANGNGTRELPAPDATWPDNV